MTHYRRLKTVLYGLVLAMIAAAVALEGSGRREIFPIFSWSLFSYVDQQRIDFAVFVTGLDGKPVDQPLDFMLATDLFPGAGDMRAYATIQDLGLGVLRRDEALLGPARSLFERQYLAYPRAVEYQVMMRTYDPIERWYHGTVKLVPLSLVRVDPEANRADEPR